MKLKNYLPLIILILISLVLCFQNYTPGTILSGWDTLHPEFNFGIAIKREVFGVFRTYQGLGAVAAHSDMADLPRIILLFLMSPFIPVSYLRYFYIFLNLVLGPIGMYYFLRYVLVIPSEAASDAAKSRNPMKGTNNEGISHFVRDDMGKIPSFLGALFYLLNLGTMQQFVVPFEMFTTQYAILPWLFLFTTEYLNSKTHQKKTLILFAITTLFSAPMAYAATLWYIYFIAFILYLTSLTLLNSPRRSPFGHLRGATSSHLGGGRLQRSESHDSSEVNPERFSLIKKAFILIILTLLINSFWILPNIYFVLNHASEVTQANINKLFSPQAFLYNKEFGNIKDISLLKTFLFDWNVYVENNQFSQLLSPWIQHLKQPFVELLGYLFALTSLFGIIYSIANPFDKLRVNAERSRSIKRNKILIALLPLLLLCLFFLINDNFPTSPLYSFLKDKIPFFKEAFRFPQDKVLGIFTFVFAIYFATGQFAMTKLISKVSSCHCERSEAISEIATPRQLTGLAMTKTRTPKRLLFYRIAQFAQPLIFVILLLYFMLPGFKGNFISLYMRIKIPDYYFEMFKWFDKEEDNGRIANLPINSLWGWEYHDWSGNSEPSFQGAGFIWFGIRQPLLSRDFDRWSPYNEQYYREMSYAIYSQNPQALKIVLEKYNIKYILFDKSIIAPDNNSLVLLHQETQTLLEKQDYIEKIKEFGNNLFVYKVRSKTPDTAYVVQNIPDFLARMTDFEMNLTDSQSRIRPKNLKITQEGVILKLNGIRPSLSSYLEEEESIPADLVVEKNDNKLDITFYPRFPIHDIKNQPIPIIVNTNLPKAESVVLSINKKDNFVLETLPSNTPLSLGMIFLKTKEDNTIAIYPSASNEEILPNLLIIKYYIEPCENIRNQKTFGGYSTVPSFGIEKVKDNSFSIFGKNISLCMTIPLSEVINKDLKYSEVLLNTTFNYQSNLPLKFCLAELIKSSCQNYNDNRLNQYFGLQRQDIQKLGLQFQLDTTNSNNIEKAFYSNLILSLTNPLFIETLPNDALKKSLASTDQTLSKGSTLILPYSSDKQLSVDLTTLPKTNGLCPNAPLSNPPLVKKQILTNNKDHFIRYTSIDGLSCDHFSYQNLSQSQAYLIAITSRNIKGLPPTLCVTNAVSRHCDIYTTLSSYKDFNTNIFLLPPYIKNENGFDINIGNLGIKKSPSINDFKSIEIIPIPYKWLSQIKTTIDQSSNGTMNELLLLPQSFEKGWKAYGIKNYESGIMNWLKTLLPFVFGTELKNHVLVNNWANGWILDNSDFRLQTSEFAIIFLPQYLEYLGFLLLLGTAVWLTKI